MRLNKYISHNSKYSRRDADKAIEAGKVTVNRKKMTNFSYNVKSGDRIAVNNNLIKERKEFTMIVYNKPKGVLVTKRDNRGRATIYHKLSGKFRHFIPIGRLDYASEGVLLMTDAPEVANILMNSNLERVYNLKIDRPLSKDMDKAMSEGLTINDARAGGHEKSKLLSMKFKPFINYEIRGVNSHFTKLRVTISEGKNRELRRFFAHFGARVLDLKRVTFGWIELNNLPTNKSRYFTRKEYSNLHKYLKKNKQIRVNNRID